MLQSKILRQIKLLDWVVNIGFLGLLAVWIFFPSEVKEVNWDWTTKEPYYFIFSCLLVSSLGITWRILIDYIKFQMKVALHKHNKGEL